MKQLFYKPLKIRTDDVAFWGCTHYDHRKEFLWGTRGFDSVEEHNNGIIAAWNSKCNEETVGVLLGDIMFGQGGAEKLLDFFNRLRFKSLIICAGNHYAGFHQLFDFADEDGITYDKQSREIQFVPNYFELIVKRQPICLSQPIVTGKPA